MSVRYLICPVCGTEFAATNGQSKYCCLKCKRRAEYERKAVKENRVLRDNKTIQDFVSPAKKVYQKTCAICGKEFENTSYNAKYCSKECKREADRRSNLKWREKRQPAEKKPTVKTCVMCGKEFTTLYATTKYCSKECKNYVGMRYRQRYKERKRLSPQKVAVRQESNRKAERKRLGESYGTIVDHNTEARNKGMSYGQLNAPKVEVNIPDWAKTAL